jgi:hypothetical protein
MRLVLTFGFVAVVSAGAGAAAQHLGTLSPPVPLAPPLASPLIPVVPRQVTTSVPARSRSRALMPVEKNPYGPSEGRLGEIAGHESGLLETGTSSYQRIAGPRPHIASNPYYFSDVDDGQEHAVDPALSPMHLDDNPY